MSISSNFASKISPDSEVTKVYFLLYFEPQDIPFQIIYHDKCFDQISFFRYFVFSSFNWITVTKRQKFSLRTGEYLITKGVLSRSRERVLKKFLRSLPPDPHLLVPSLISIACINFPMSANNPYTFSRSKTW